MRGGGNKRGRRAARVPVAGVSSCVVAVPGDVRHFLGCHESRDCIPSCPAGALAGPLSPSWRHVANVRHCAGRCAAASPSLWPAWGQPRSATYRAPRRAASHRAGLAPSRAEQLADGGTRCPGRGTAVAPPWKSLCAFPEPPQCDATMLAAVFVRLACSRAHAATNALTSALGASISGWNSVATKNGWPSSSTARISS